jgi:hypothetical protein
VPVFQQRAEPNALDPLPPPGAAAAQGTAQRLLAVLGTGLQVRDPWLGENAAESDYQFIAVEQDSRGGEGEVQDIRLLSLDHLQHGFLGFRMPGPPGAPFDFNRAVYDRTVFKYGYLSVKAVLTARAFRDRFAALRAAGGGVRLAPPRLRSLVIGGGSYTFPRYFVERFGAETYTVAPGDTLRALAERLYGVRASTAADDVVARLRAVNGLAAAEPAAGTVLQVPSLCDVAELDPAVTEVNHTRFKLPRDDARIKTWQYDGRNFVEAAVAAGWTSLYDVVCGDAVNHYSVPFHLTTREFNEHLKVLLVPRGIYLLNVIDRYETLHFVSALATTLRHSFRHVYLFVERDPAQRHDRSTFVLAASDRDLRVDFPGGLSTGALKSIAEGDLEGLADAVVTHGDFERLRSRIAREGKTAVHADLEDLTRFDLEALFLAPAQVEAAEEREDGRLDARDHVALTGADLDALIDRGRPRSLRAKLGLDGTRAGADGRRAPIVLTDDHAPVDELLSPLLEE